MDLIEGHVHKEWLIITVLDQFSGLLANIICKIRAIRYIYIFQSTDTPRTEIAAFTGLPVTAAAYIDVEPVFLWSLLLFAEMQLA
jgi:hypothetical protein